MPAAQPPIEGSVRNPGSQSALRLHNQQRVIDALAGAGPLTQTELARQTGLSTATISNIVKTLTLGGSLETSPTTSSGRRASLVRLSSDGAVAVGIEFGRQHLRILITNLSYDVLGEEFLDLPAGYLARDGISRAAKALNRLLDSLGIPRSAVLAVGVGVASPIDRRTNAVAPGGLLPEWVGVRPAELEGILGLPVLLENDANLGALAEITWGQHTAIHNLVYVTVGAGIGAGLIVNGGPYCGSTGLAGEIGHDLARDNGMLCHCGRRGCLETVATTTAMGALLGRGTAGIRTADILAGAFAGDQKTLRVLDDAGQAIGRSLACAANLLNPEVIVVGGPLAVLGEIMLAPIRRGLAAEIAEGIGDSTAVVLSLLGERAEALGAAALVLRRQGIRDS